MTTELTCTPAERRLIEAVLDDHRRRSDWTEWTLPCHMLILSVLEERAVAATMHPAYAPSYEHFLSLPWRRQLVICERLGLTRDEDGPAFGHQLFERIFPRVLERGALRHFQIQLDFERDVAGIEKRTAAASDIQPRG